MAMGSSAQINDTDYQHQLRTLEDFIAKCDVQSARTTLLNWLQLSKPSTGNQFSVGELLALYARSPAEHIDIAAVALRCANVAWLLEPDGTNQIARSVVQLAEGALPELVLFLKIDKRLQNFEKYQILSQAHKHVVDILAPFRTRYGDLTAAIGARRAIIGSLAHNPIRVYLRAFGLDEVRRAVEDLFGRLHRIARTEESLSEDAELGQRSLQEAFEVADSLGSFLSTENLRPLLENISDLLQSFISQIKNRFSANIQAAFDGQQLHKRYPLHESGRDLRVSVPMRNIGPGNAIDVVVVCSLDTQSLVIDQQSILLGTIPPGAFQISFGALVVEPCAEFRFILSVEWGVIGSSRRVTELYEFCVIAQSRDLDWSVLEFASPYSTEVAEGDSFVGRIERVRALAGKILRTPMEPFYVTGQKRVGKTSLAKAAADLAVARAGFDKIKVHYILWGEVAHADPSASLRHLGTSIESFIIAELPSGLAFDRGDFSDSLSDLLKLSKFAESVVPQKRFVIILDEFDEIHERLYRSGDLAAAFFANLRAISRAKNICMILVGGENMPYIMERQGQKLNNFSRVNLNYYSRTTEWEDFSLLIARPTVGLLTWHQAAITEVYNITSGNPYFAKLICANVFAKAVAERDGDVTDTEVRAATELSISALGSHSFAHLWQDGTPRLAEEREPDWLRRMRVLVAIARCLRNKHEPTAANISQNKAAPTLSESEITAVLNDFTRREILREASGRFQLTLPIFQMWLTDVGAGQLVADALSEELAGTALAEENAAIVKAEEIVRLVNSWPTYCGRRIGTDEVRAWLDQADSKYDQRLLFSILKRTRLYGEPAIREKLKQLHVFVRQILPLIVRKSASDRRSDVIVTYLDGPAKSGANYAALYAEENKISAAQVVAPETFRDKFESEKKKSAKVSAVVVVDDIAATGGTLSTDLETFITLHRDLLKETKLRALVLLSTPEAQATILDRLRSYSDLDLEFRAAEILTPNDRAFPPDGSGWETREMYERALALCQDLGSRIYRNQPLGYGGLGLLVVFPNTVPNNTLPIIHSHSKGAASLWRPLFLRPVN